MFVFFTYIQISFGHIVGIHLRSKKSVPAFQTVQAKGYTKWKGDISTTTLVTLAKYLKQLQTL